MQPAGNNISMAFTDSYLDMGLNNHELPQLSTTFPEDQLLNSHNSFAFPHTNFYWHQSPEFPGKLEETLSRSFESSFDPFDQYSVQPAQYHVKIKENNNIKSMDVSQRSSRNSATPVSQSWSRNENNCGKRKRIKISEKPKEAVHVRARRGQATDNHSLAERVRRKKINERIKCLQDIVPGCYKAKGMASMLDEIIHYVQCLQNQIEFLSMKLTTASTSYEFGLETDLMKCVQAKEGWMSTTERQGGLLDFQPAWPF